MWSCRQDSKTNNCEAALRKHMVPVETKTVYKLKCKMWERQYCMIWWVPDGKAGDKNVFIVFNICFSIFTWSVINYKEKNLQDVLCLHQAFICLSYVPRPWIHWLFFNISLSLYLFYGNRVILMLKLCQHSNSIFIELNY